jgi:ribosomal protein L11 methyltransferase
MNWLRISLDTDHDHTDAVSDALEAVGASAVTLEDAGDQPILEPGPGETPLWSNVRVVGLFGADSDTDKLKKSLSHSLPAELLDTLRIEPLEDRDWSRAWMERFQPMRFGERVWIVPSWSEAPEPQAVNILLDPGLAFGTGTHPTTALCLQWLDAHAPAGKSVMDYGCGSGILGIAAARLGASQVWGIDNDPQALQATRDNAIRNQVDVQVGLPGQTPDQQFDVVIANILAGPLAELAPTLCALIKPGGQLVISGLLPEQKTTMQAAYATCCPLTDAVELDGWLRLAGEQPAI